MGYGDNIILHGADALITHRSQDPGVVIIEYDVHGNIVRTGASYDNRFISVITIEDRKDRALAGLYGLPGRHDCA